MNYTLINITSYSQGIIKGLLVLFASLFLFFSCQLSNKIKDIEIEKSELILHPTEGKWYYGKASFYGYAIEKYANGKLKAKTGFHEGKKEGVAQKWDDSGALRYQCQYIQNHKDGLVQLWSDKGVLIAESNFKDGVVDGVQRKWYPSGKVFKKTNINMGKEEGLQQTWWENGKLYVNYEAKNGRIFGLKRSTLCYELENELVQK
jgi:antitoxin component YwqK of YwqJK toxin-antitoxin module